MIVRILSRGTSFKGLAAYLTHDAKAATAERIGWTHTLNLAHDHVPSAVDEMLWTARQAELLKQEAGIRAGGRETENTVKHLSLNWSPEDDPSREHMIETAQEFLRHMGWQDHQALLVGHTDKTYAHLHIMLNMIDPENGLRLDDDFERRRAQKWALEYEREQGRIYCEQRLQNPAEREDSMPRNAWMAFNENQKSFEREEIARQEASDNSGANSEEPNSIIANFAEWKNLKEMQKRERLDFFADGKSAFSELRRSVYREVREEFRERWADYYAAAKSGTDEEALALTKAELVSQQKEVLESRRDEACKALRETRDGSYRELLADQRDVRSELRTRQEMGFDNGLFLEKTEERIAAKDKGFREAAEPLTARPDEERNAPAFTAAPKHERTGIKSGPQIGTNVATGLGFGLLFFFESLADGFVGSKPDLRPRPEPEPEHDLFDAAIDDARKRQQLEKDEADSEWRKRQRSLSGE